MIFGFAGAAIAGFLLTAVPSWTETRPVRGLPLAGLAAVWLAGRAALWSVDLLPAAAVGAVDVLFFILARFFILKGQFHTHPERQADVGQFALDLSQAGLAKTTNFQ